MALDRSELSQDWQNALGAVETMVGGCIINAERQARWRPAWFLDLETDDGPRSVFFRGAKLEVEGGIETLRHEFRCLELLEKHGIEVPHVYGYCEDPEGIVMAKVPGRANLATAKSEEERKAVRDHYMEMLARIHALPVADFAALGMQRRTTPRELALGDLDSWVANYRRAKSRPHPMIEFMLGWISRNAPEDRTREAFLVGDSGQFVFDEGRVTALIDVEFGHIGDPAHDLGALLSRDISEPLGDLEDAIQTYERVSGDAIDRGTVNYHAVRFALYTPLAVSQVISKAPVDSEYVQNLAWYLAYGRCPLEIIARIEGIELEEPTLPDEVHTPWRVAQDALAERFASFESADSFVAYQVGAFGRIAEYLRRADRYGAALEADDMAEAEALLGRRPTSWQERDQAIENLVLESDGDRDEEIVCYLVRHIQREEFLLKGDLRELEGVHMQALG